MTKCCSFAIFQFKKSQKKSVKKIILIKQKKSKMTEQPKKVDNMSKMKNNKRNYQMRKITTNKQKNLQNIRKVS